MIPSEILYTITDQFGEPARGVFTNNFSTSGSSWEFHVYQWNIRISVFRSKLAAMGYTDAEMAQAGVVYDTRVGTPKDSYIANVSERDLERDTQQAASNYELVGTISPLLEMDDPSMPSNPASSIFGNIGGAGLAIALYFMFRGNK